MYSGTSITLSGANNNSVIENLSYRGSSYRGSNIDMLIK